MRKRSLAILVLVLVMASCRATPAPTPTPDAVATEVALQQAVAATLTALAPVPTLSPGDTPTVPLPTDTPTAPPPSSTPAPPPPATSTEAPTPAPTRTPTTRPTMPPTATPRPSATPRPITWRAEPYVVVGVASDDELNVRSGPGISYRVVGTIPPNGLNVQVGEEGKTVDGSPWVPVWYQGTSGWANSRFLARQVGTVDSAVVARASQIVQALRDKKMARLASWVDPEEGLRFSPYGYVTAGDQVFDAADVPGLLADPAVYLWGSFDGSGEPILFTFGQYYERFVYSKDFAQPHVVGLNQQVGTGNSINNIADFYPGSVIVEYHFEGFDPRYGGMDWQSLRLVLKLRGGAWVLVGIVHDEWTI
jgi:uncharacterized protein YgiM (DUF1202 family)